MEQINSTSQPTFDTREVIIILNRARKLIRGSQIVNGRLGGFRSEKRLEGILGSFIIRAIGTTAPGRGPGRKLWHFEFIGEEYRERFEKAEVFTLGGVSVPYELLVGSR